MPLQEAGAAQHTRAQPDGGTALAAQAVGHLLRRQQAQGEGAV